MRYRGDYTKMPGIGGNVPTTAAEYYRILKENRRIEANSVQQNTVHMKIEVTKNAAGQFKVKVSVNNTTTYEETIDISIAPPRIQTHWGSGVVFSKLILTQH